MGGIEKIRAKIPNFPGYDDEESRIRSDELVRAYVGEAVARLNAGQPEYFSQQGDQYGDLLLRCGFANQTVFRAFDHAQLSVEQREAIAQNDLALLELADRGGSVQAGNVAGYVQELLAAFDRRESAMKTSKPE